MAKIFHVAQSQEPWLDAQPGWYWGIPDGNSTGPFDTKEAAEMDLNAHLKAKLDEKLAEPNYYDAAGKVECDIDGDKVYVTLPSVVWLTPEQAENFANALNRCAAYLRNKTK